MKGRRAAVRGLWLAAAWLPALLLIALPLAGFLAYSLFRVEGSEIVHEPGLANYARFFGEGVFLPVFLRTCLLAAEVAGITVLVGYPVAIWLASLDGRRKLLMVLAFAVPLLMSYIIKIYAIRAILGGQGWLNRLLLWSGAIATPIEALLFNLTAVLITLSVLLLPFTIVPLVLQPDFGQTMLVSLVWAGLFFVAFCRDPRTQYVPLQAKLSRADAMAEYLVHTGSGLWAVPPGVRDGGYWGQALLEA